MRLGLLLVLVAVSGSFAQSGFQEGFLLTSSLDTVRGEIRFSGRSSAPESCLFRTDKKAVPREISPGTVHGFCTNNGAYYFSRTIDNTSTVYMEVLVKGYMNLFKFGDVYYVEKADSAFFELSDDWEVSMADGRQTPQKSRNHMRMLALLMSDCPGVSKEAEETPLRDKQLVRVVASYNRCKGSETYLFRVKARRR